MPSVVKNQSQFRVPPTPCTTLPFLSAKGNCNPEFAIAVLFPAAGLPMIMYQGNSYNARDPDINPSLDVRMVEIASSMRLRTVSSSPFFTTSLVDSDCFTSCSSASPRPFDALRAFKNFISKRINQINRAIANNTKHQRTATSKFVAPRTRMPASAKKPITTKKRLSVMKFKKRCIIYLFKINSTASNFFQLLSIFINDCR